jgi:hypothetical protein
MPGRALYFFGPVVRVTFLVNQWFTNGKPAKSMVESTEGCMVESTEGCMVGTSPQPSVATKLNSQNAGLTVVAVEPEEPR